MLLLFAYFFLIIKLIIRGEEFFLKYQTFYLKIIPPLVINNELYNKCYNAGFKITGTGPDQYSAYNRENIFYFNRIEHERVNQLPLLPSAGISLKF